jgi:pyridoxamine 5'-phosphate oxidase
MANELWQIGEEYAGTPLDPASCDPDPFVEVRRWLQGAIDAKLGTPNAMTLATVDERGRPAARMVLLKDIDERGFVFYTNYESRKGRDLAAHPHAAIVLFWEPLHRQVRVEGAIERLTAAESDAYFASRPRAAQLGAIASPQSQVLADRAALEARIVGLSNKWGEGPIPRPSNWGGYRVVPEAIELWQGQPSRLHDRVKYELRAGSWVRGRLAP